METPFGPFEPTVELDESQSATISRSLSFFEAVMTASGDLFSIDVSQGQPLIVKTINGKRLELPVLEAAELDSQRLYGYPPTHQVPLHINGLPQNVVSLNEFGMMVDALTSILLMVQNIDSVHHGWFQKLFE